MTESSDPTILIGADGPESLDGRRIVETLACVSCTYDLRGLEATGACPECGVLIRQSILRSIDPEVHRMPRVDRPAFVAFGVRWFFGAMGLSFCLWIVSGILVNLVVEWNEMLQVQSTAWPSSVRNLVGIGRLVAFMSMAAAAVAIAGPWFMRSMASSKVSGKSLRILLQLAIGACLWLVALLLQDAREPGAVMAVFARESTSIGSRGTWLVTPLLITLSPMVGGCILLLAIRSFFGEMGRRSREFRQATTKRQKVLDVLWASLFWCMGAGLQFVGAGNGLPTLVTFGTVVRFISGLLVAIGIIYLLMNLRWIAFSLATPPPRLKSILSSPEGESESS